MHYAHTLTLKLLVVDRGDGRGLGGSLILLACLDARFLVLNLSPHALDRLDNLLVLRALGQQLVKL